MNLFWLFTLAIVRPIYFIYSLSCLTLPFFVLYCGVYYFYPHITAPGAIALSGIQIFIGIAIVVSCAIPILVYCRRSEQDPNPFQSAFMSWYGTLRWYWNSVPGPMAKVGLPSGYLVENPMSYRVNAEDMRAILALLKPGDILLRAYDGYLDGKFIRQSSLCQKCGYRNGWFTHAALFAGALDDADRAQVPHGYQHNKKFFQAGPQMVLHSMAQGVHCEDILTWLRCDYLAILRLNDTLRQSQTSAAPVRAPKHSYPSDAASQQIEQSLRAGLTIPNTQAIQNARESALQKIGEPYDFECIETNKFHRFSCAEYVYFCYRSVHEALGLIPQLHAYYPLGKLSRHFYMMGRITVTPDDYYRLAKTGHLEIIWVDAISKKNA